MIINPKANDTEQEIPNEEIDHHAIMEFLAEQDYSALEYVLFSGQRDETESGYCHG